MVDYYAKLNTSFYKKNARTHRGDERNCEETYKKVLENGIAHKDTIGELNLWMNKEFLRYGTANNMHYYAGYLYIFSDMLLITVIKARSEMEKNLAEYVVPEAFKKYKQHRVSKDKKTKEQIIRL